MSGQRHWGHVVDYDRDDDGNVIANAVLRIQAPSVSGSKAIRVGPLLAGVYKVPQVGASVAVYRLPGNRYCWTPEQMESDLPDWMREDYPNRAGFTNNAGTIGVFVDGSVVRLALPTADVAMTLWPALKALLNADVIDKLNAITVGGTPVDVPTKVPHISSDSPASTKVLGV